MFGSNFMSRFSFWINSDRIGPDIPTTFPFFYFPNIGGKIRKRKFKSFGKGAEFRPGAYAINCSNISIGERVVIRPGTMLFATKEAGINIENDVLIANGVHIYVSNHRYSDPNTEIINQGHTNGKRVVLKKGCWVGAQAILLEGVTIGENAVVAAGSIVTKDVPPRSVVAGNPAIVIKNIPV